MNQQDKNYVESICAIFHIPPADKREYLMGVADGIAAMVAAINTQPQPPADRPSA